MKKEMYHQKIIEIGKEISLLQEDVEHIVIKEELSLKSGLYSKLSKIDKLTKERYMLVIQASFLVAKNIA